MSACARLANTDQSNISRSFRQQAGAVAPGVDRVCSHNIAIFCDDGTAFETRAQLRGLNYTAERMRFPQSCALAVGLQDDKEAEEAPMPADLDPRLQVPCTATASLAPTAAASC